jgi:hypothetical protein
MYNSELIMFHQISRLQMQMSFAKFNISLHFLANTQQVLAMI